VPALAALCGCGGVPAHLANPTQHPSYPPAMYITGVGTSADGRATAEASARAAVSRQIRSTISSAVRREVDVQSRNGQVESKRRFWQQVEERSAFAHGELIRIDGTSTLHVGAVHYAFAFLSRSEADARLTMDHVKAEAILREAHARGVAAAERGDIGAFAKARSEFQRAEPGWKALAVQRQALRSGTSADVGKVRRWSEDLLRLGGQLRGRTLWRVQLSPRGEVGPEIVTAVARGVGGALTEMGLNVAMDETGQGCNSTADAGQLIYVMDVGIEAEHRRVSLGQRTDIRLPTEARACAGEGSFRMDIAGERAFGMHPSEQRWAVSHALDAVKPKPMADRLRGPVGELCPLK
jgi:hypothetical protein